MLESIKATANHQGQQPEQSYYSYILGSVKSEN